MKTLINFLDKNEIEWEEKRWGDNYFDDNFVVMGLCVSFDLRLDEKAFEKKALFLKTMERRKNYKVKLINGWGIWSYRVLKNEDAEAYEEHMKRRDEAVRAFEEKRHRELMATAVA